MSCFADCFCWQRASASDGAQLSEPLSPALPPSDVTRRPRADTKDFQASKVKLSALNTVLDQTPRTRQMATESMVAADSTSVAYGLPAKITEPKPAPLGERSNTLQQAPASTAKKGGAFGALSDLLEQTPRTRVAAAADTPKADEAADASLMADMDVSALVAEAASALDQPVSPAKVEADEAAPRPCDMSGLPTPAPEDESL